MLFFVAPRKSGEDGVPEEQVRTTDLRQRSGFETATSGKCEFLERESRDSYGNDAGFQFSARMV